MQHLATVGPLRREADVDVSTPIRVVPDELVERQTEPDDGARERVGEQAIASCASGGGWLLSPRRAGGQLRPTEESSELSLHLLSESLCSLDWRATADSSHHSHPGRRTAAPARCHASLSIAARSSSRPSASSRRRDASAESVVRSALRNLALDEPSRRSASVVTFLRASPRRRSLTAASRAAVFSGSRETRSRISSGPRVICARGLLVSRSSTVEAAVPALRRKRRLDLPGHQNLRAGRSGQEGYGGA